MDAHAHVVPCVPVYMCMRVGVRLCMFACVCTCGCTRVWLNACVCTCCRARVRAPYHSSHVSLDGLQLLKLLDLALLHVCLELPGAVLVGQRAPLHQVVDQVLGGRAQGHGDTEPRGAGRSPEPRGSSVQGHICESRIHMKMEEEHSTPHTHTHTTAMLCVCV